jgi:hypothetical protein
LKNMNSLFLRFQRQKLQTQILNFVKQSFKI